MRQSRLMSLIKSVATSGCWLPWRQHLDTSKNPWC